MRIAAFVIFTLLWIGFTIGIIQWMRRGEVKLLPPFSTAGEIFSKRRNPRQYRACMAMYLILWCFCLIGVGCFYLWAFEVGR